MIRFLLLVSTWMLSVCIPSYAQNIHWSSTPNVGFVFQISNSEAEKLLTKSRPDSIIHSLLHTRVDTFNVNKGWTHRPDRGHFILVKIVENKLHCEYTSVFPYQVLLLKEYNALSLQVIDLEGNVRKDAKVKFKARRIRFDPETKTYRIDNGWFTGTSKITTVELDGFRSVFNIEKHEVPSWDYDYSYRDDDGPDFYSYMITDKNKYKPGERVRFKSYALNGSRTPIKKDLDVWLMRPGKPTKIGKVTPHRPGSFVGDFVLHDSLKLTLDRYYTLQLQDKHGRLIANCNFRYEDYELNGNRLFVGLESRRHFSPAPNFIKIFATTENGLVLQDAKAQVTVMTENIREVFEPVIVLRDTLISRNINLDGNDTTFVEIPASIFGKSNTTYVVQVVVLNSQKQRMERSISAAFDYAQYELANKYSKDSIIFELLSNGSLLKNVQAKLFRDNTEASTDIILPYREKINPATKEILIASPFLSRTFRMSDMPPSLRFIGGVKRDSFNIAVTNPQKIHFSWFIYQGSMLLEKGSGTEMKYRSKIEDRTESYYAELLYSFAGQDHIITEEFAFRESSLDINVNIPERIYPGQKVEAVIEVTDEAGNAVSGVDLTAMATTAKLNYYAADLPYYGTTSYSRSAGATYSKKDVTKRTAILDLDYQQWVDHARLDTMLYYQFTYPAKKIFLHQAPIDDSTQFAPFVMKNGIAQSIYVIEVDRQAVYYSWTQQPKGYSFYVEPESYTQITLRLHDRVLMFKGLCFERGMKTIMSVDLDHLPESIEVQIFKPEIVKPKYGRQYSQWVFSATEKSRLTNYLAAFQTSSRLSYLKMNNRFIPISSGKIIANIVAGPIHPGTQTYVEPQHLSTTYKHVGGFSYLFEDNIVYKQQPPVMIPDRLNASFFRPMLVINDVFINQRKFLQPPIVEPTRWHPAVIDLVDYSCRLRLLLPEEHAKSGVASVLFQPLNRQSIETPCKGTHTGYDYFTIARGLRNIILLYNNGTYLKMDSIELKSYTNVVIDLKASTLHAPDSASKMWMLVAGRCYHYETIPARTFKLSESVQGIGNVRGSIRDESNEPLPGVNVVVKGTTIGTVTDINGNFELDIPYPNTTLVISFIGLVTQEVEVRPGSDVFVSMQSDVTQLSEVVVVGYGTSEAKSLSAAVMIRGAASLQGRVAGVQIQEQSASDDQARQMPQEEKREAEKKLYQELLTLKNIRSQFSDVGFWEPKLFTDRHGRSKFTITFPEDITRWDAVVYGMNSKLQTGTARKSIRSYKPLMAELHVPQFLTVGDSADFVGKILNYTSDKSIHGRSTWKTVKSSDNDITFDNYHTEQQMIAASSADTITTSFSFTRDDGYFDGEKRAVPVIEQGTLIANGTLKMLKNNDKLVIRGRKGGVTKVVIMDNQLDLYKEDVRYLLHYKYDCNEQLASKLIGLLNYKVLTAYEGKTFRYDKDVNKIIQRLLRNQNEEFLWSWWDVSPNTSYWMSAHILRALKAAKDAGYAVKLDIDNVVRKATYNYEFLNHLTLADVQVIHALAMWNAPLDYQRFVKTLDQQIHRNDSIARIQRKRFGYTHYSTFHEKLMLLEIRQLQHLPFVTDSLLKYKRETVLQEIYFTDGQPVRYWYNSEVPSNAIAYRIIKRDSVMRSLATAMQMYFISLRRKGGWNTYESSNVLMSILPDLVAAGTRKSALATASITGKKNQRIQNFPFTIELVEGEEIQIFKESGAPLYCTEYTEERVVKARNDTDAFTIKTIFDDKKLKAGQPVILKAVVEVKRDAALEHVMIEIPIPAGCSYAAKRQFENAIETHREYFKEKTSIFCENMKAGTYVFQVHLLPKFSGKYFVNPAQVSLMYFPVVNANTGLDKVVIKP